MEISQFINLINSIISLQVITRKIRQFSANFANRTFFVFLRHKHYNDDSVNLGFASVISPPPPTISISKSSKSSWLTQVGPGTAQDPRQPIPASEVNSLDGTTIVTGSGVTYNRDIWIILGAKSLCRGHGDTISGLTE